MILYFFTASEHEKKQIEEILDDPGLRDLDLKKDMSFLSYKADMETMKTLERSVEEALTTPRYSSEDLDKLMSQVMDTHEVWRRLFLFVKEKLLGMRDQYVDGFLCTGHFNMLYLEVRGFIRGSKVDFDPAKLDDYIAEFNKILEQKYRGLNKFIIDASKREDERKERNSHITKSLEIIRTSIEKINDEGLKAWVLFIFNEMSQGFESALTLDFLRIEAAKWAVAMKSTEDGLKQFCALQCIQKIEHLSVHSMFPGVAINERLREVFEQEKKAIMSKLGSPGIFDQALAKFKQKSMTPTDFENKFVLARNALKNIIALEFANDTHHAILLKKALATFLEKLENDNNQFMHTIKTIIAANTETERKLKEAEARRKLRESEKEVFPESLKSENDAKQLRERLLNIFQNDLSGHPKFSEIKDLQPDQPIHVQVFRHAFNTWSFLTHPDKAGAGGESRYKNFMKAKDLLLDFCKKYRIEII